MHRLALRLRRTRATISPRPCVISALTHSRLRRLSQLPSSNARPGTSSNDNNNVDRVADLYANNYASPTLHTLDYFRRFLKFSAIGLVIIVGTTLTAFEAAHQYVEHVQLKPERNSEIERWGWADDAEKWTGGDVGGTDPALGLKARHAIRGAWIAQHWGTGSRTVANGPVAGNVNQSVDASLAFAHDFLNIALQIALQRQQEQDANNSNRHLRPQTLTELFTRLASVLERMGTKASMFDARTAYERIWGLLGAKGLDAARTAWRIGDLSSHLGDYDEAHDWWIRAIHLTAGNDKIASSSSSDLPLESITTPSSPRAQRILASTLCSLSAYHAQRGELKQARKVEEEGMRIIKNDPISRSISIPEKLHHLYLAHRYSLLTLHLAEVSYAQRENKNLSLARLKIAARAAERIAFSLTATPERHPDIPESTTIASSSSPSSSTPLPSSSSSSPPPPPVADAPINDSYSKFPSLEAPATSLLRDSRRTAIEAWTLAGHLHEIGEVEVEGSTNLKDALDCYERALGWASVSVDEQGGIGEAGSAILEKEWMDLWTNYLRVREVVLKTENQ